MFLATQLNCSSLIPSRVFHMPIGSDNSRLSGRATPQCVTSASAGRRPCQPTYCRATLRTTDRLYRRMRIVVEQRKLSRNHGERFWRWTTLVSHARSGSAATAIRCSPREPTFGTRATMGCGGLEKISASTTEDRVYLVRFLDDPGPIKLPLSPARYTTSAGAVRGSWCLQVHVASAFSRGGPTKCR